MRLPWLKDAVQNNVYVDVRKEARGALKKYFSIDPVKNVNLWDLSNKISKIYYDSPPLGGDDRVVPLLFESIHSSDPEIREYCVTRLWREKDRKTYKTALQLAHDRAPNVRGHTVSWLGGIALEAFRITKSKEDEVVHNCLNTLNALMSDESNFDYDGKQITVSEKVKQTLAFLEKEGIPDVYKPI